MSSPKGMSLEREGTKKKYDGEQESVKPNGKKKRRNKQDKTEVQSSERVWQRIKHISMAREPCEQGRKA